MRKLFFIGISALLLTSCGKSAESTQSHNDMNGGEEDSSTQALYESVMDIHDEVMPQMNDIYKLKKQLSEEIANSKDLVESRKRKLESLIFTLDSANNAMMNWMRNFQPPADSLSLEDAHAYLEDQMEKINGVKAAMLEAIERAKQESVN